MRIQHALVTGASAGLGAEFARQLADHGVTLTLVARRRDRLDELAATLPVDVEVLAADLTDGDDRSRVEARLAAAGSGQPAAGERPIDLLVNNAGFGAYGRFAELDLDRQAEMVDLNVAALTRLAWAVMGQLVERGTGGLINVASTAAYQPDPFGAVYGASKAYVRSLTEALHEELRGTGVHAMLLSPGFTDTEFQAVASVPRVSNLPKPIRMDAASVVRAALRDFGRGRAVCLPGAVNLVGANASDISPTVVTRKLSKLVHGRFAR